MNGGIERKDMYRSRAELVLASLSDLYSKPDLILVNTSGPSSNSTSYCLLTTCLTNYCLNEIVNDFDLRRSFFSKQCFKNNCCSSIWTSHK